MNKKIITLFIVIFSLILLFVLHYFCTTNNTQPDFSMQDLENSIVDIVAKSSPSIVNIVINKDLTIYRNEPFNFFYEPASNTSRKVWGGTGFFVSKDGIIITNAHLVEDADAEYTAVLSNGKEYALTLIYSSESKDIALMKIDLVDEKSIPLKFIKSYNWDTSDIKVWQFAIATWYAFSEYQNSVSLGVISGLNRNIDEPEYKLSWLLQTDAAIHPWNSGWPLMNINWKVMWINTAISTELEWIWFAIPFSQKDVDILLESIN